jgi:hypothetical protein
MIAAAIHPAHYNDLLAGIRGAQLAAMMRPFETS